MIQEDNFEYLVKECLKFNKKGKVYQKYYLDVNCEMMVDFENKKLIFPVEIVGVSGMMDLISRKILLFLNVLTDF